MTLRVVNIYPETISDGFGIRFSIYLSGCGHRCKGCHNPQSWDPSLGQPLDDMLDDIVGQINKNPMLDGITVSGGDPFYNPSELIRLLKTLKEGTGKNIWCYTGYTYEKLIQDPQRKPALEYIDVLVDGSFMQDKLDPRLFFRGSSNQRIIYLENSEIDYIRYPELEDGDL
ncbi:MAG: anaerobic ribonucleoside-triphosphate reductase activating protein [Opitutales bacterium]